MKFLCEEIGHSYKLRKTITYRQLDGGDDAVIVCFIFTVVLIPFIPIYLFFARRQKSFYEICERCGHKVN